MNYLYQITNLINNKIYIGVHRTDNIDDDYMGSGTAIIRAIKKYGIENFRKDILEYFDTYEEALLKEEKIVTKDFLLRKDVYNLRTGGIGGFEHINNVPPEDRKNLKELKRKIASGEIKCGGSQHWTEESYIKVRKTGWANLIKNGVFDPDSWKNLTAEERIIRSDIISKAVSGTGNGSYGTHIYIDSCHIGKLPNTSILNKNRFKEGEQPTGWITVAEWRHRKKNKDSNNYGRHWYNDGIKNYYLYPNDIKIKELNLIKKRLTIK